MSDNKQDRSEVAIMSNIKVLSLWQPFASLVVNGIKKIETRPSKTNHQGIYLIHATKKNDRLIKDICQQEPFKTYLKDIELSFGKIIGKCEVRNLLQIDDNTLIPDSEFPLGNYEIGRWAWRLHKIQRCKPFEYKGSQGYYANFNGSYDHIEFIGEEIN